MANKELMKEIAGRLREWWGPRKIKELAEKTGIPYSSVAAMMAGELQQSAELLRFVAENGGDVNYILTGKRSAAGGEPLPPDIVTANEEYSRMEPEERHAMMEPVLASRARHRAAEDDGGKAAPELFASLALFFCLLNLLSPWCAAACSLAEGQGWAGANDCWMATASLTAIPAVPLGIANWLLRLRHDEPSGEPSNVTKVDFEKRVRLS